MAGANRGARAAAHDDEEEDLWGAPPPLSSSVALSENLRRSPTPRSSRCRSPVPASKEKRNHGDILSPIPLTRTGISGLFEQVSTSAKVRRYSNEDLWNDLSAVARAQPAQAKARADVAKNSTDDLWDALVPDERSTPIKAIMSDNLRDSVTSPETSNLASSSGVLPCRRWPSYWARPRARVLIAGGQAASRRGARRDPARACGGAQGGGGRLQDGRRNVGSRRPRSAHGLPESVGVRVHFAQLARTAPRRSAHTLVGARLGARCAYRRRYQEQEQGYATTVNQGWKYRLGSAKPRDCRGMCGVGRRRGEAVRSC